jgi:hypothetical protein
MRRLRAAVDVVLGRNYLPKGIHLMVHIRFYFNRLALVTSLVLASAVAAGWKWDRTF